MIFNTWVFALFTLITFALYWLVPTKWRAIILLTASYVFFTYHFPLHTLLILVMTLIVYWLSLQIFKYKPAYDQGEKLAWYHHPKFYLTVIIVFSTSILAFYKYLKMAIATVNTFMEWADAEVVYNIPEIIVPLGLSFFVFEFIHYAVDVYQGKAKKTGLFQFALFIMYFPSLVSGPIKRYESFNDQTIGMGGFKSEYLYEGLTRILIGIGKKTLIADKMTPYADFLLDPATSTPEQLWIGMYAYSMKIFFDFSGYTDIAIGTARLFGYRLPENFNYPYLQSNLVKFWNNWHMSLSSWIRDYVYIPLGGSRGTVAFAARNSLLAMMVSGLWHGAAWHFVFWGFYHGVGMAFLRFWLKWKKEKATPFLAEVKYLGVLGQVPNIWNWKNWIGIFITFHYVSFGWIFFYCEFDVAVQAIRKMIGGIL